MNKLFRLKNWLTIEETAKRLSLTMEEEVTATDCLQLALDGHLTISALLNESRYAVLSVMEKTTRRKELRPITIREEANGIVVSITGGSDDEIFIPNKELDFEFHEPRRVGDIFNLSHGVYDLPMLGCEEFDVMHLFDLKQGREPRTFHRIEGSFLLINENIVNIMAPFNRLIFKGKGKGGLYDPVKQEFVDFSNNGYSHFFYPADSLGDVEFVFRRENIEVFEQKILQNSEQPLTLNQSLLVIGSMLHTLKKTKIPSKRWTQDALKAEILENDNRISPRVFDDYFASANKAFKSNS